MIRVAICDDNIKFTGEVENLLFQEADNSIYEVEADVFFDGKHLEDSIRNGNRYDLIYIDIEMRQVNGIDVAKYIREMDRTVQFIYISRHERYWRDLFDVMPFQFLTKPLDHELFRKHLLAVC